MCIFPAAHLQGPAAVVDADARKNGPQTAGGQERFGFVKPLGREGDFVGRLLGANIGMIGLGGHGCCEKAAPSLAKPP